MTSKAALPTVSLAPPAGGSKNGTLISNNGGKNNTTAANPNDNKGNSGNLRGGKGGE